jgi:hypothetical protein
MYWNFYAAAYKVRLTINDTVIGAKFAACCPFFLWNGVVTQGRVSAEGRHAAMDLATCGAGKLECHFEV